MKKFIFFLIACIALVACQPANAQTTTPRTGTGANNDNTYRALTYKFQAVTDATGNDTIKLNLNAYQTLIRVANLVDSINFNFTPITRCYAGDLVTFVVKNSSGGTKVKFVGSNVEGASGIGSNTITASKRATFSFIFDGTKWLEISRDVQ